MSAVNWADTDANVAATLRARGIESDLADAVLKNHATAAVQEIAARGLGPAQSVVFYIDGWGQRYITLPRPAASITTLTENGVTITAGVDGYRLLPGGMMLERLAGGLAYGWSGPVAVTAVAAPADERYDRVVTDLVKLALQYSGLDSRRDGDYAEESMGSRGGGQKSYQDERDILISELAPPDQVFA